MQRFLAFSLCASATIVASAAFNADTMAFYSFGGKTVGASALGGTVQNDVDTTKYQGTVYQAVEEVRNAEIQAGGGEAYWSDDRPAKYVFEKREYGAELLATDPGSLYIPRGISGRGAICAFASLASDLGDQAEWTVEWFWKIQGETDYPRQGWFSLPLWTTDRTGNPTNFFRLSATPSSGIRYFRIYASTEQIAGSALAYCGTNPYQEDGQWHHVAISYKNNKATVTLDYDRASNNTTMDISSTNAAVELLLPFSGLFYGRISCIRVTKKQLSASDFMGASDNPGFYPRTAFHWSLDGEAGTEADGVVSNRAAALYDSVFTGRSKITSIGMGQYGVDTNGNKAAFSDSLPKGPHRRQVREGKTLLGEDGSSLYLKTTPLIYPTAQGSDLVQWTSGTMITATNCCPPVTGSFTMEMFAKLNFDAWRTNTQYIYRKRTTLMGCHNFGETAKRNFNWSLEFTPNTSNGSLDTFKINAYTNTTKGVSSPNLGARFSYLRGWHHIALTYDATEYKMRLYVDYEQQDATFSLGNPQILGNDPSKLVYYVGGGLNNHSFDGWIDEVRLVRECLTPDKFLQLRTPPGTRIVVK